MRKQILLILPILAAMFSLAAFGALTSVSAQEVNMTANQTAAQANVTGAPIGGNMTGNITANVTPAS